MHIEIREKNFGDKLIFKNLSLTIADGEFLVVAGPSGCGKTTLLRLIAGLDQKADIVFREPPGRIGFVFQEPRLLPWRSVEDNLLLACEDVENGQEQVQQALQATGMWPDRHLFPDALSLGMKRRVELARALAIKPELLLLDEPFVSLDRAAAAELRSVLLSVWEKTKAKIIMVSHDQEEGLKLADRMIFLAGQPAEIIKDLPLKTPRHHRDRVWVSHKADKLENAL